MDDDDQDGFDDIARGAEPCDGEDPTQCECEDGTVIPFSETPEDENMCPSGKPPATCTCPNGDVISLA